VAILMTADIAVSWSFGRELVGDALPALLAIAIPGARWLPQGSSYWPGAPRRRFDGHPDGDRRPARLT
jgi:hypothetical protein